MSEAVLVQVDNGVMTVTINRAEQKNAINLEVAQGIAAAMDELDANPDIRSAILTGAGGTFCAGMDLKAFVEGVFPHVPGKGFGGLVEAPPRKPLIAAVEGYALAGGFELAMACDLIVASEASKFGIPEAKRGLVAGAGGLMRLPRQLPKRVAMELALTGDFMSAARAESMGMINRVVPAGQALAAATELAQKIAENGPMSLTTSKAVINQQEDWTAENMWAKQQELVGPIFSSHDAIEGAKAFAEKRKPNWKGC